MHRRKSCITRGEVMYCKKKFMHRGKIMHSGKEVMHWKKFMHREKVMRRRNESMHSKKKFMHPVKKSHNQRERNRASLENICPSTSTASFYFDKSKYQENHRRRHKEKYQHCISFYSFWHGTKSTLNIILQT